MGTEWKDFQLQSQDYVLMVSSFVAFTGAAGYGVLVVSPLLGAKELHDPTESYHAFTDMFVYGLVVALISGAVGWYRRR